MSDNQIQQDLRAVFARQSQVAARYRWFADLADVEGQPEAASRFRAAADAELGRAIDALEFMIDDGDPITGLPMGDTIDNLRSAISAERHAVEEQLPAFADAADSAGRSDVADWFRALARAGEVQAARFEELAGGGDR